ncbi:galactose-3-O-sulfotransferase 4-like isoform X3 [Portunus trituberculatus]|uniref:galactose-3-O-sulfotransferase 4-like isoform X3 n=1 Tax=Portunus trituberculatus TaxID=210409 RepID=UPI001E1CD798|nr:galactose-3-O-sulfotransferase 4-like isoform X3 [Portunus trituberculatus]
MGRRKESRVSRKKDSGGGTTTSLMLRLLMLLCVVSSMALVLQLNLTNQHNLMLRNIQGAEEPRAWAAQPAGPTCRPRRHLVFLKTHKCGSSTLQSVFLRYAAANNLSVALPYSGVYLDAAGSGQSFRVKELKESPFAPPSGKYHLLVHHTRLNVRAMQQVTYNDSVWVTVLREPSAVFESMFHYYHLHKFFGATFDHLVWKLGAHDGVKMWLKNANTRYQGRLGRNQMSFDLGLDDLDTHMDTVLRDAIKILDDTFHLVMIAERMDESLVLLKHLLCWGDEDVMAMAHNVRKDLYRSYLSEQTVATLEHFNAADVKLYSYFKEKFDKHVEAFGRGRMEGEVANLRAKRDKMWKQCGLRESRSSSSKHRQTSAKDHHVVAYQMHVNGSSSRQRKYCQDLIRPTPELTQMLRWKQYARYHQRGARSALNLSWSQTFKRKKIKRKTRKGVALPVRRIHRSDRRTANRHRPQ